MSPLDWSRCPTGNANDFGGMVPDRPLIAAIGCGGTISSLGRDSMDVLDYPDFGTKLPIDQVLARYPEIATDRMARR